MYNYIPSVLPYDKLQTQVIIIDLLFSFVQAKIQLSSDFIYSLSNILIPNHYN